MASDKLSDKFGYQQRESYRLPFYYPGINLQLPYLKRTIKMAQVKWALILCDMLGIPVFFMGITANIDNVRSAVLFILATIYIMIRGYFFFVRQRQAVKEKDIELWHLNQDKQDRIKTKK